MTLGAAHPPGGQRPVVIWRFVDGKPGHDNQSRGLVAALARHMEVDVHDLVPLRRTRAVGHWLRGRYPETRQRPAPALIVGAGHGIHGSMLAARRARGGRIVVLMRPSLPLSWFDLCIIPAHDRPPARANVLPTQGVLNAVHGGGPKDAGAGLMLIGGPSRHVQWREAALLEQIRAVIARSEGIHWTIATSRRTPDSTADALQRLSAPQARLVRWQDTDPDWLPGQLQRASVAWISADSVSMVYEALTAGAACGVLHVPMADANRVRAGVESLLADGLVTSFEQWRQGAVLSAPPAGFDEAGRCARWIERQWLNAG